MARNACGVMAAASRVSVGRHDIQCRLAPSATGDLLPAELRHARLVPDLVGEAAVDARAAAERGLGWRQNIDAPVPGPGRERLKVPVVREVDLPGRGTARRSRPDQESLI